MNSWKTDSAELSRRIRISALRMVHRAKASHIGTCLSMSDLLGVLYGSVLQIDPAYPDHADRDRFILSKGHGAAAIYSVLAACGFFPESLLETYCENGTTLAGHVNHHVPGVDFSTGSLGHGLSLGAGVAKGLKADCSDKRSFVLLSDGELDEGSIWEAVMFSAHHRLDNLVAIVDYNKIQSFGRTADILDLAPLAEKWTAFGWAVREIDGHDYAAITAALSELPAEPGKPTVVIAHTIKGKGVSFMEDELLWHYRSPNDEQLQTALLELGAA